MFNLKSLVLTALATSTVLAAAAPASAHPGRGGGNFGAFVAGVVVGTLVNGGQPVVVTNGQQMQYVCQWRTVWTRFGPRNMQYCGYVQVGTYAPAYVQAQQPPVGYNQPSNSPWQPMYRSETNPPVPQFTPPTSTPTTNVTVDCQRAVDSGVTDDIVRYCHNN